MASGHIRLNKLTREWVIYAPARRKRPQDFQNHNHYSKISSDNPHKCPFCSNHEHELEPVLLELPNPDDTNWQTRVVTNKFPALSPNSSPYRYNEGIYLVMSGYGRHEVVIESPEHDRDLANMSLAEVEIVIETYHRRYIELMQAHENMMAIIFRNHGVIAGASLKHPHSQIIVTGMVPQHRRWREQEAQRHFDDWGRCLYCEILDFEIQEQIRIILENEDFVAFVPFAAEVPFEVWIMPKLHQADFGSISPQQKKNFAAILREMLIKLANKLNDPDYNYVINTAARYKAEEPQLHWYCQIKPRLTTPAGFEIGSGISINPSIPEQDADFLRD